MARILLTHVPAARAAYYGEKALGSLRDLGEVRLHQGAEPLAGPALVEAARDCDVIVSDRATAGEASLFQASPRLVAFVRCAVDIRTVDVEAASRSGILVTRASAGFVDAVVELLVGQMIDAARGITAAVSAYRAGRMPEVRMGRQLAGSSIGIIGYGRIGRRLAEVARAMHMTVRVHDPYAEVEEEGVSQVAMLPALLRASDFVVCLAIANEETECLMDAAAFAEMQPHAWFVNGSRGNLVDEAALVAALDAKRIAGATMDVGRDPDQMPTRAIASRPDVIATPHIGGLTPPAIEHQALETVAQVAAILGGKLPVGAVNADEATRLVRFGHS
ncbi:MAG: hydroxyacid dehydrogenase [Ectothiorhodospiraceae bacterium]|nr:hydroxyacid dehydrogenase [Chromatiales bacterium]MCP5155498.1 hydroxyacid dehydrogenase [Ectothiorhodospiraceae bacterium]